MSDFDIIKAARTILASLGTKPTLPVKTTGGYKRMTRKLVQDGKMNVEAIISEASKTRSTNTWSTRRAALKWSARQALTQLLAEQDQLQRKMKLAPDDVALRQEWLKRVGHLDFYTRLADQLPVGCPIPKECRDKRHSKRQDLGGLPRDWREKLLRRFQKYYLPFLVTAVTGCRPEEMATGILLTVEEGELIASIQGAKVTDTNGQEWRELGWTLPREGLVALLAQAVCRVGNELQVKIEDPRNFSTAVSNAGKREWPLRQETVTPYCLRHTFSADSKASGMSREEVAGALGHSVDTTCQYYGMAHQAGSISVHPDWVEVAKEVRKKFEKKIPRLTV